MPRPRPRVLLFAAITCIVLSTAISVGAAAPAPHASSTGDAAATTGGSPVVLQQAGNATTNETSSSAANGTGAGAGNGTGPSPLYGNDTNTTWDGDWNSSAPSPGGGGGLFGFSPVDFVGSILEWFAKAALNAASDRIDWINAVVSGMPAPGEPTDPSTWTNPSNGLWPGVWNATQLTIPLAAVFLGIAGTWAFRFNDAYQRRQRLKRVGIGTAMVLLTWFVAPLGLHFGSTLGVAMAPSGSEFLATPGNFAKFGVGFILAVILSFLYVTVIVIGLFVLAAQYFLTHAVVFFWPIAWSLRAFDGFPKSLGDFIVYLWGALIALNIGQAMLLRLVFELPWGAGGAVGAFMGFLGTTAGLAFALIWFPKTMLEQVTAGSAVGLGVSAGAREAGTRARQAKQKVGDVREQYVTSGRGSRSSDGAGGASSQSQAARSNSGGGDTPNDTSRGGGGSGSARSSRASTGPSQSTLNDYGTDSRRAERERRRTDHAANNGRN